MAVKGTNFTGRADRLIVAFVYARTNHQYARENLIRLAYWRLVDHINSLKD